MQFDIWSVSIVVFIFQGLFLVSTILMLPKAKKKKEHTFLLFLILGFIWFLLEFLAIRNTWNVGVSFFYGTRYGSWLLMGPLTYFYFKAITTDQWQFSKKELLHFVPFLVCVFILPLLFENVINSRQVDYGMLSVFDHRKKVISPIQYAYSVIFIAQFIHLGAYVLKNLQLINRYKSALFLQYATINSAVRWLKIFNILMLVVLAFSIVFLYLLLITDIYRRYMDYIYVLPIGILIYITSFYIVKAQWKPVNKQVAKYANNTLELDDVTFYKKKLDNLIANDKIFLDNEIRLDNLAAMLQIKTYLASQLINQHYGCSFYDFINGFRIKEAKNLIEKHPEFSLLKIAFESGFNNKTSFVNAFKKFEKLTPSKFREKISVS